MSSQTRTIPTYQLVLIGLLSSIFFSATFVMNYVMHLGGGHWLWSAALRFVFMLTLLLPILCVFKGIGFLRETIRIYLQNLVFWTIAGGIGFGIFYAGICYVADYSRGWLVAATWQSTILMSPLVLAAFGLKVPIRGLLLSLIIVFGVILVNYAQINQGITIKELIHGVTPVLLSAIAYPMGNQLLNCAKHGTSNSIRKINSPVLGSSIACVLLMSLGSVPFWLALLFSVQPPPPSTQQVYGSFSVAFFSGICATGLFYWARNSATSAIQIAAVDATLAGEVIATLAIEVVFLKQPAPDLLSIIGLMVITLGLVGYCFNSSVTATRKKTNVPH